MKELVPAMIGIGSFMIVVVGVLWFNMPDDNPSEGFDITIDGAIFDSEPKSLVSPVGEEVGLVARVEREDGNTVLEFSRVLRDVVSESAEVYLADSSDSVEGGVTFPGITIGEFVIDVTSEQLEEYQFVVIYDEETEAILATANLE